MLVASQPATHTKRTNPSWGKVEGVDDDDAFRGGWEMDMQVLRSYCAIFQVSCKQEYAVEREKKIVTEWKTAIATPPA